MSTVGAVRRNLKKREYRYNVMNFYHTKKPSSNRRGKKIFTKEYISYIYNEKDGEYGKNKLHIANNEFDNKIVEFKFSNEMDEITKNEITFNEKIINNFQFHIELINNVKEKTECKENKTDIDKYNAFNKDCDSKELTSSQKVAHNDYLMNIIIGNIYSNKDRIPLELTCRTFYNVCNSKNSKVSLFSINDGDEKEDFIYNKPLICSQGNIFVNFSNDLVSKYNVILTFNSMKKNMELFAQRGSTLVIKKLPFLFTSYFKKIENISNINTVCFNSNQTAQESLCILNRMEPALMPTTVIFENVGSSSKALSFKFLEDVNCHIPNTVKRIYLNCGRNRYLSLIKVFKKMNKMSNLEQITFGSVCTLEFPTREELHIISRIANCFNNVKIIIKNNASGNIYKFILMLLDKFNLQTTAKQEVDLSIYMTFLGDSFTNVLDRYIKSDTDILLQKYALIKAFRVFIRPLASKKTLSEIENYAMILCLRKMINLETLELNYSLIDSVNQFSKITKVLSPSLKNVKLYSASKMSIDGLLLLKKYVPQIKNLNLQFIRAKKITLKFILESFKKLTGLRVDFGKSYNFKNILSCLTKFNVESGQNTLNWPNLSFLEIHCQIIEDDMIILNEIERNTPRRSGKFMLFNEKIGSKYINGKNVRIYKSTIIIQTHSKNYINFKNLFKLDDAYHGDLAHFISREGFNIPYRY